MITVLAWSGLVWPIEASDGRRQARSNRKVEDIQKSEDGWTNHTRYMIWE